MVGQEAAFSGSELARLYQERFSAAELEVKRKLWEALYRGYFRRFVKAQDTVLDLAAGSCEFINACHAANKIAVDLNKRFDLDYSWKGDDIEFKRSGLAGALHVGKDTVKLNCELGDRLRQAVIVFRFARLLALAGEADAATRVLATGAMLQEEMGARPMAWLKRGNDESLALIRARLDDAAFLEAWEQGRALTADEAVTLALTALTRPA